MKDKISSIILQYETLPYTVKTTSNLLGVDQKKTSCHAISAITNKPFFCFDHHYKQDCQNQTSHCRAQQSLRSFEKSCFHENRFSRVPVWVGGWVHGSLGSSFLLMFLKKSTFMTLLYFNRNVILITQKKNRYFYMKKQKNLDHFILLYLLLHMILYQTL